MTTAIRSHYADLGDGIVHYLSAGEGEGEGEGKGKGKGEGESETVVLLHGIPQTSHEWRFVMPRLAEKFRVIAPDLRGLGDSSRPATGYDKKTVAADVWRLVHDHLKIDFWPSRSGRCMRHASSRRRKQERLPPRAPVANSSADAARSRRVWQ